MNYNHTQIIKQTQNWLTDVVIGLNFCPFARKEFLKKSIRYTVVEFKNSLDFFASELEYLNDNSNTETTLLIIPNLSNFEDFLDIEFVCNDLLIKKGYEGIYQIATFHPDYCFDGNNEDDATNYTNKSPYPMLHLLRESSLENALEHYENPEEIPTKNMALAEKMGSQKLEAILQNCFKIK